MLFETHWLEGWSRGFR